MARERTYGWSPEQLARVNARREARGQEAYVDERFNDRDYSQRYTDESESYSSKKQRGPSTLPKVEEPRKSLFGTREERNADFKKRFESRFTDMGKPSTMPSNRAIKDEEFRRKTGKGAKGISTPMTKDAMERVMGTA
jgi:hypothetical protein